MSFQLAVSYCPKGNQKTAIAGLSRGLLDGEKHQVMLGVTGSGKMFTMANLIEKPGRPSLLPAAKRSAVADIILPSENELNVKDDLKAEQVGDSRMRYVKTTDESVPIALARAAPDGLPFFPVRPFDLDCQAGEELIRASGNIAQPGVWYFGLQQRVVMTPRSACRLRFSEVARLIRTPSITTMGL